MKLNALFEDDSLRTPKQVFLKFQQLLIDLDDTFEQAEPPWVIENHTGHETGSINTLVRMRFESPYHPNHYVRTIILTATFVNNQNTNEYTIQCFGKTSVNKAHLSQAVGRNIFRRFADTLDDVMVYLERVLSTTA